MLTETARERLRRLRRASRARTSLPASLRRRLGRGRSTGDAASSASLGEPEGLEVGSGPEGSFASRSTCLDLDSRHGDWELGEARSVEPEPFRLLTGDESLAGMDLGRAVFLDTETTGLGGGAGVHVFLIGLGTFGRDGFRLWQGFLRGPEEERALLGEVSRRIRERELLVSFFGKSFDRHRLEDKMRIALVEAPFAGRPHLDLYHPLRRLTRGHLCDSRLSTMERELCGVTRRDDLPGSEAPRAWFDYLAGRAHRLEDVFRHNRDDVLSLLSLAAYLGSVTRERRADGRAIAGCPVGRARALWSACAAAGEQEAAGHWLDLAIARETQACRGEAGCRDLLLARADRLRRGGEHDAARAAYEDFLARDDDAFTLPALIQFAKLLEHRFRDPRAALALCRRAELAVARGEPCPDDLAARIARLHATMVSDTIVAGETPGCGCAYG